MPIRVYPQHNLGPCLLTLDSITKITELVSDEYPIYTLRAIDGIWEIYDEPKDTFLNAIADHDTLDTFVLEGEIPSTGTNPQHKRVRFVCNRDEAKLVLEGPPDQLRSFEHLKRDIESHIRPPTFGQRIGFENQRLGRFNFLLSAIAITSFSVGAIVDPATYCKIIIKESPPNPLWENIKANLLASLIWFVLGILGLLMAQWVLYRFGVDITPWD